MTLKLLQSRVAAVVLGLVLSAAAQAGVDIQQWTLPSGARVSFVETHALPMLDVQVDFVAGSAYAPVEKAGLAELTAGLLDAGTDTLDENALADRFADLGAQFGAGAETDRATVSLRTLSSATEREAAVALVAEILRAPAFPEAVLGSDGWVDHAGFTLAAFFCGAVTLFALRRFLLALVRAQKAAAQAECSGCHSFGRLEVIDAAAGSQCVRVRCRACGKAWTMDDG